MKKFKKFIIEWLLLFLSITGIVFVLLLIVSFITFSFEIFLAMPGPVIIRLSLIVSLLIALIINKNEKTIWQ